MKCEQVYNLIPDYSVENLPRKTMNIVREHIESCPACTEELRRLEMVMSAVDEEMQPIEPPVGLWNGVYNRITSDKKQQSLIDRIKAPFLLPRRALSFGVGVAVLAGAIIFGISQQEPNNVAQSAEPVSMEYVQDHMTTAANDVFADRFSLGLAVSVQDEDERGHL